jgi:membrane protein YdbS with pleckstrin-like domain
MSNKTRSLLKAIAVIVVLLCVLMQLGIIPTFIVYQFWIVVIAFGVLLIASK